MADQFEIRGLEFIKTHPDFFDVLNDAERRLKNVSGPTIPEDAVDEIQKLARPDVAYYLASPANASEAHSLLSLKGERVREKIRRIASRLDRQGTFKQIDNTLSETDSYIQVERREAFRTGKRRRR
jgi:hypothetical protein